MVQTEQKKRAVPRKSQQRTASGGAADGRRKTTQSKKGSAKQRAAKGKSRRTPPSIFWRLTKAMISLAVWLFIASLGVLAYYAWDLPGTDEIAEAGTRDASFTVLDKGGNLVHRHGSIHGDPVKLDSLPAYLPAAILAIEDRRFYNHPGIDPIGLARAAITNLAAGGVRQGGSTLSQQLAKNLFLTRHQTIKRKIQEVMLALWLEATFTKDQILEIYMNRIYLGAGVHGVDAAARRYFGKPAHSVTLFEAAVIAGLPKAPSRYSPYADPELAAQRASIVLNAMVDAGVLDRSRADAAKRPRVAVAQSQEERLSGRYFADWAIGQAADIVGGGDSDLVIRTTMETDLQRAAENTIAAHLPDLEAVNADQIALIALRPDGAVAAVVGGTNWLKAPYNRAIRTQRQPGSTFKLFAYLAALEQGLDQDSLVDPKQGVIGDWRPRDFGQTPEQPVTLKQAFATSLNTATVALGEQVGRARVLEMARKLGISSTITADRSLVLGVHETRLIELTSAYGAIATGGYAVTPFGIQSIATPTQGDIYKHSPAQRNRVISNSAAKAMHTMLKAVIQEGTGKRAKLDRPAGGKTGTSQEHRDALFVGYTPHLVTGVWIGNDNATAMKKVTGGGLPARIWADFMRNAHAGVAVADVTFEDESFWSLIKAATESLVRSSDPQSTSRTENSNSGGETLLREPTYAPRADR